jgi:hypothetical protein
MKRRFKPSTSSTRLKKCLFSAPELGASHTQTPNQLPPGFEKI